MVCRHGKDTGFSRICAFQSLLRTATPLRRLTVIASETMAENADETVPEENVDPRIAFLSDYTLKALKLKSDKWAKMFSSDEARAVIVDYLEKPDSSTLVVYLNQQGQLTPSLEFPTAAKLKSVYFVKREKAAVSAQNARSLLAFGDLFHAPLDHLSSLVDEVQYFFMHVQQRHIRRDVNVTIYIRRVECHTEM